ncbi:MAG TPA: CapA family protein [Candidatus Limnocylindrales bacterium]
MNRARGALVPILLAASIAFLAGCDASTATSAPASARAGASSATGSPAVATPGAVSTGGGPGGGASGPPTSPTPAAPSGRAESLAIVPVTQFRTTLTAASRADVAAALGGTSGPFDGLELVAPEADAILAALGAARPTDASRLVLAPNASALAADLAGHRKRLGFLRSSDVGPGVRALGWENRDLFGGGRVAKLADWPLTAQLPKAATAYDPAKAWTLVAGGDILLDRGVAQTVKIRGKGVDFPFDGGSAEITGRCRNCSPLGWDLPYTTRTGGAGAVRELIKGADLAIANFENPAPNRFAYHTKGTVFSADPKLIDGLRDAGIDYVSLANNHIRDAGAQGILDTMANLDRRGIAHSGAGANLAAARAPGMLEARGTKVAILAYDTIAKSYGATPTRAGSAQLNAAAVRTDVAAARRAGANVVIVFPHWGTEYDPTPFAGQQRLARACVDAGADLVIGNHAHWAGAMETYKGKPIWYALGNFVFDQTWSEPTMEGITLELTFNGATLVQARMRPHIILDKAQPNFLDPAGSGRVVMGQVFGASKGLLAW